MSNWQQFKHLMRTDASSRCGVLVIAISALTLVLALVLS
jgi:hypothetical protein